MTYQDQLRPWAIFRRVSLVENVCVARFRTRPDAYAYMSILRMGRGIFEVMFDRQSQEVTKG